MGKNKFFDKITNDYINDKNMLLKSYIKYMLVRTQTMFRYLNLPLEIPPDAIEHYLQCNGNCIFTFLDGKYYVFTGGYGGTLDAYYQPTIYTVNNPYLKLSKNYVIDNDCILIKNDSFDLGMIPILQKYGCLLVENFISMKSATINLRMFNMISASDDKTKASADIYIKHIIDGDLSVVGENGFFDGVKMHNSNQSQNYLTQFIELHQYLKASCFNEIGLNANYNMKRESINSNESQLNNDFLLPFIDQMYFERKKSIDKINDKYGLNIAVEFNSSWEVEQLQNEHEKMLAKEVPENDS